MLNSFAFEMSSSEEQHKLVYRRMLREKCIATLVFCYKFDFNKEFK